MNLKGPRLSRIVAPLVFTLTGWHAAAQELALPHPVYLNLFEQARAHENGEGVARNPLLAAMLYCEAARQGDRDAQYNLGWMYANGRGVVRDDAAAAYLFQAAAAQGIEAAQRVLVALGNPTAEMPECLRAPEPEPVPDVPLVAAMPRVDYTLIAPKNIFNLVMKLAPQFNVEPQLALAIMAAESNFNPQAVSPKNAQGLMQLIPETSARFNVKNAFDPAQNIRGGLTYLRWLLAYFEGDVALVAAAYNAGEGTVERYRGVPPYMETRNYVQRILRNFGDKHHPFEARVTRPSPGMKIKLPPNMQ
ncbi:MAG: lytic transglycosylase [Comamonadaceae bacterium CG_4_9_14_3_um_filter_60_33]|nr:MAG: lytic transglycosylase [Comamonadaceae bacterium CG_4_9_14_3_um_filter_60_33]